jgi:hypothetical protein
MVSTADRLWTAAAMLVAGALLVVPTSIVAAGPSLCLVRNLVGHECPGCGMTRAISSLLHGRLEEAVRHNWLVVVVYPLLCVVFVRAVWRSFGAGAPKSPPVEERAGS